MNVSRRGFLGGTACLGAVAGCRGLGLGLGAADAPNLKLGVLSDVHVQIGAAERLRRCGWKRNDFLVRALEWYRAQGVDAVVIAGDLADQGLIDHLEAVAEAWYGVFPNDRYPDGHPVEKVFVAGNHDWNGWSYNRLAERWYPDANERRRHLLQGNWEKWQEMFHEDKPFAPLFTKRIRGYDFIGAHWYGKDSFKLIARHLREHGKELDPSKPFFYVQHAHPKDTCYGPWAWGHDDGTATAALSAFPNAIAISGHSHYPLTDERSLWQGTFTSVGAGSLSYAGLPYDELSPDGFANTRSPGRNWKADAEKLQGNYAVGKIIDGNAYGDVRSGMLWSIYDDRLVIRRRDFTSGLDLGDDWTVPLPSADAKPFAFALRAKKAVAPHFAADAKLTCSRMTAKNRGGKSRDGKESVPVVEHPAYRVSVPAVAADREGRVKCFEVTAKGLKSVTKTVLAEGFHLPLEEARAQAATECVFDADELGDRVTFSATPIGWFGTRGKPLTCRI